MGSKKGKQTEEIKLNDNVKAYIQVAVNEGIEAGKRLAAKNNKVPLPLDPYRETEKRLRAMPILVIRVKDNMERLQDLTDSNAVPRKSKDMCRFHHAGLRLTDEEILDELKADIKAQIARDEYEIQTVQAALALIKDDKYYPAVEGRYFHQKENADKDLAKELKCEERTVSKRRVQLVQIVAVRLYGADAVRK